MFVEIAPRAAAETMIELGIRGGPLHQKYRIYLDRAAVCRHPGELRRTGLVEMFPGAYSQPPSDGARSFTAEPARRSVRRIIRPER